MSIVGLGIVDLVVGVFCFYFFFMYVYIYTVRSLLLSVAQQDFKYLLNFHSFLSG